MIAYDCEVFAHNWLVVFKDLDTGQYTKVWDDGEELKEVMDLDRIYVGFNSKHYDQYIIKGILSGFSPEEVKQLNDFIIIHENQGWQYPLLNPIIPLKNVDIRDDSYQGQSLKSFAGHLFLPIRESSVPFDINRALTEDEKKEVEQYCKHDVDITAKLVEIRKNYLQTKADIGKLIQLPYHQSLSMTNAKLTALVLQASKKVYDDEREYVYPDNLDKTYIPQEIFNFFDRLKDKSIPDDVIFKEKHDFKIGGCSVTVAYGGVHGAIDRYRGESSTDKTIVIVDVGAYYPHLCVINGYTSRAMHSPQVYADVLETRMKAKAEGNSTLSNALKLVCNTTYGCMLNQYNDLYDPLMGRSVCISGQLYLIELAMKLYTKVPGLKIIQLNTDGIIFECHPSNLDLARSICRDWEDKTGFELEEDLIDKLIQKDVNNYLAKLSNGKIKRIGADFSTGISNKGAFNASNSMTVVAEAVENFLLNGVPIEETVNACEDLKKFQIIAKAGKSYEAVKHETRDAFIPCLHVNRVYSSRDPTQGKLLKFKNGRHAKIASLPDHCVIDNENQLSIDDIDKNFYIDIAKKKAKRYQALKRKEPIMAEKLNIYQKLNAARLEFLKRNIKKTGKNMHQQYKYFELEDIVPPAIEILNSNGLFSSVSIGEGLATMTIQDVDNQDSKVDFMTPFVIPQSPVSSTKGTSINNDIQMLGYGITYIRRYLYMLALDIVEPDEIDSTSSVKTSAPVSKPTPPASPIQRTEIANQLTNIDGQAEKPMVDNLKRILKALIEKDPMTYKPVGTDLALKTENFTKITRKECEQLIEKLNARLEENHA